MTRGFLGFTPFGPTPKVFDFDELIKVIQVENSLDVIWSRAFEELSSIAPSERQLMEMDTPIGGYMLRTPSFILNPSDIPPTGIGRSLVGNVGRNEECSCGSGLKHKNCCLVLI